MRNAIAVVLLLAVCGLLAFFFLTRGERRRVDDEPIDGTTSSGNAKPEALSTPSTPGLARSGRPRRTPNASPDGGAIRDFGGMVVALKTADGAPLSDEAAASARIDIDPLGTGLPVYPLALAQPDGTWLYESLPVGSYRVRAVVRGYQTGAATATVKKDEDASAEILLAPGAEIVWKAVLFSGEPPASVRLALLDGRGQSLGFDLRTGTGFVRVPATNTIELSPQGTIMGLAPGKYRLRATSPSNETDEQSIDAKPGASVAVDLRIRR